MARPEVSRREFLVDDRGDVLRVTWHPGQRTVVLSEWRGHLCRATFQLRPRDVARLAAFLVASLGQAATTPAPVVAAAPSLLDRLLARLGLGRIGRFLSRS
jgi:hypothetical protein